MQKVQFMYKYFENKLPAYINNEIPKRVDTVSDDNLQNKKSIHIPKSKNLFSQIIYFIIHQGME